ncbi:uncharacterized protein LOC131936016 [Physella acuta]|uniref:uncharacterized protein LOC131936016 n=1 Tax=Physella acuta TaxID=109671 RepID=UPI0027DD57EB|nr:uncharacterized protein LOC131936016 [Physella acuta]
MLREKVDAARFTSLKLFILVSLFGLAHEIKAKPDAELVILGYKKNCLGCINVGDLVTVQGYFRPNEELSSLSVGCYNIFVDFCEQADEYVCLLNGTWNVYCSIEYEQCYKLKCLERVTELCGCQVGEPAHNILIQSQTWYTQGYRKYLFRLRLAKGDGKFDRRTTFKLSNIFHFEEIYKNNYLTDASTNNVKILTGSYMIITLTAAHLFSVML